MLKLTLNKYGRAEAKGKCMQGEACYYLAAELCRPASDKIIPNIKGEKEIVFRCQKFF